jgi:hypothetical protein
MIDTTDPMQIVIAALTFAAIVVTIMAAVATWLDR